MYIKVLIQLLCMRLLKMCIQVLTDMFAHIIKDIFESNFDLAFFLHLLYRLDIQESKTLPQIVEADTQQLVC